MPSGNGRESDCVERLLDPFRDDLWIHRRLALDEVIESLKQECKKHDEGAQRGAESSLRRETFQDYIRFVEFLKDQCSGENLTSDKQWGHLLNLMSVSRKVNHRSAKFNDIIKSKDNIESSFQDIRTFNEAIKQATNITRTLEDLDRSLESCELGMEFSDHSTEASQQLLISEVSKAIRHIENTSGPLVSNLRMQLSSKSMEPLFERDRQTWRDTFNRLECIFDSFRQLLNRFEEFLKNLSELRPLLKTLDGRETECPNQTTVRDKDTLQCLLTSCKAEFQKVVHFERRFSEFLKAQIKQKSSTRRSAMQQVQPLHLSKLLDARFRFKDDILTVGLEEANKTLRHCQATLIHIKRSLRLEFGRFYFLNDLELLTVISLDVRSIEDCEQPAQQRLLRKLFNNSIEGFTFGLTREGSKCITGVKSSVGENIDLGESNWVPLKKPLNMYSLEVVRVLNEVLRKLRRSLSSILQTSIESWNAQSRFELRSPTNDFDWKLPIQLFELTEHVKFTKRMESELSSSCPKLEALIEFYEARLDGLRSMWAVSHTNETSAILGLKVSAAISLTVHFIAQLMNLKQLSVGSVRDWSWQKLPRFYLAGGRGEGQLEVKIATATFVYRFDLLCIETTSELDGKSNRAVVGLKRLISTTSSDRCFLAASQAISKLKSGASPFGAAGGGKTETIKALGHLLGCQVIVHNCDETNEPESLELLIWGLAHTGLWGCFDEFNRLSSSTLSSVSSVLELVQASLRAGSMTIQLDGAEIKSIDPDSAFFVTLNPGDSFKYRGRRRLPANLRSLFLPVAMYHVQIEAIVRQMLLVHGASASAQRLSTRLDAANSSDIARRFSRWIQVARVEFAHNSRSNRCEFDLRLVVVILKRSFHLLAQTPLDTAKPTAQLREIMTFAIQTELFPRLEEAQLPALERTLSDCFAANATRPELEARLQLETQLEARSGVILLGQAQSGKSTSWRTLLAELNGNGEIICCWPLNPKAHSKDRLFGHFDMLAAKWIDGIFTKLVRRATSRLHNEPDLRQAWIILDGHIDPDWIESLNSVLDDNQVLTLASGERINFIISADKCIKLIFETVSIQYASPATISRLGLVYHAHSFVRQKLANNNSGRLDLTIVYGGSDSGSRFDEANTMAGSEQRSIAYACNEHSNSDSLVDLLQLSSNSACTFILQNLEVIANEDKWATRTFVELLRYILTYGRFHDKDLNEIGVSERTRFIITVESLDAIADPRLVAIARTTIEARKEADKGLNEPSYRTVEPFLKAHLHDDSARSGVLAIRTEHLHDIKRDVLLGTQTADIVVCKFNSEALQIGSVAKLEKLLEMKGSTRADAGRKCIFLIDSLELYLMNKTIKRKLYHLVNLLSIRNLIGGDNKILVFLDKVADQLDRKFWGSIGQSCSIESAASIDATRFEELLERKLGSRRKEIHHLEWLSQQVATMSAVRESIVRDHFVAVLIEMIAAMSEGLRQRIKMLRSGLHKLSEFEGQVEEIKAQKQQEDGVLREQKLTIEKLMQQIDSQLASSENKKAEIGRLQMELGDKSDTLETQTRRIQSELDLVLPLIDGSRREVSKCLKPEALNEIRALRAPPKTIKDILDVLFLFLDLRDTSWASVKAYLTRASLRDELTNYDFEKRLDSVRLEKIKREIESRRASFHAQQARRASAAIVPILNWINAALEYGKVSVRLKPLAEERDRLESEAQELRKSMSEVESERKRLEEKVLDDRELLEKYQADYSAALAATESMAAELSGAGKIVENSAKQVSWWRERLNKLEALATNEKSVCQICLLCAATTIWADTFQEVGCLLTSFGHRFELDNQLEIFGALTRDNVNMLLDSVGEEHIETITVKSNELTSLLQLVRLKLSLLFRPQSRPQLPFVQFHRSGRKVDENLVSALSSWKVVCSADQLLVVRPTRGAAGSWRQSFELGLRTNQLLAIELDKAHLDTVDMVLQHCHSSRIVLFGEEALFLARGASNPLRQLLHIFAIDQPPEQDETSLADRIAKLVLQHCQPRLGSEMDELERSLVLKQHEQRSLEASLLKKLNQSSLDKNIRSLSGPTLKSDLIGTLNELQKASESLAANIEELKRKLSSVQMGQVEYVELSKRLANFYVRFLWPVQESEDFYALPVDTLVELLAPRSCSATDLRRPQIAFGSEQLGEILSRVMCSMRPECRLDFRHRLLASLSELAGLVHATDVAEVAKLVQSSYKRSAHLCDNLVNLLTVDRSLDADGGSGPVGRQQGGRSFELVVILHDEKKPSPQVVVDELFRRAKGAFIAPDNELHYEKVYATSQRQAAAWGNAPCATGATQQPGQGLEAHLRRLMMSPSLAAASNTSMSQQRTRPRTRTKCVCVANAHLATGWINTQLLELLNDTCRNADERYVFLLIGESSEQQQQGSGASPNNVEPGGKFDLSILEAATLKFWYDELALNALDRYNLYLGSLRDAYATAGRGHKSVAPIGGELAQNANISREQLAAKKGSRESSTGELIEDLVMFHVVCQELIRLKRLLPANGKSGDGPSLWQKADYNFDHEQLSLALKVWSQLDEPDPDGAGQRLDERAKRELLCHLLESIVYGSRLETVEDEELLKLLLSRFLREQVAPSSATVRNRRLLALERLSQSDLLAPAEERIGGGGGGGGSNNNGGSRYAKELAGLIGVGAERQ